MSSATLPAVRNGTAPANVTPVDAATMEKVVVNGDLSKLNPAERLKWYEARCNAAGLDPRTQPFQYLSLQGRLTLYATKAATDQLIAIHKLTVEIPERTHHPELGVYEVRCRVAFGDGRHVEDVAVLSVAGLKGEALCNALMKCVTKAKRRTVLSACGLGMLDETEVETIPGAARVEPTYESRDHHAANHDNATGHGSGAYAAPADVARYRDWLAGFVQDKNGRWLDKHTSDDGEVAPGVTDLLRVQQVSGHLCKWAAAEGLINAPEGAKVRQYDPFAAVAFARNEHAVIEEANRYARDKWREAKARLTPAEDEPVYEEPPAGHEDEADPDVDFPEEPGSEG